VTVIVLRQAVVSSTGGRKALGGQGTVLAVMMRRMLALPGRDEGASGDAEEAQGTVRRMERILGAFYFPQFERAASCTIASLWSVVMSRAAKNASATLLTAATYWP
jgi:hypothetical protein